MSAGLRLWIAFALLVPTFASAQTPSEADELRRRLLMRFPGAGANGDGTLSQAEAVAFRQEQRASRKAPEVIAPPPTHEDVRYGPFERNGKSC